MRHSSHQRRWCIILLVTFSVFLSAYLYFSLGVSEYSKKTTSRVKKNRIDNSLAKSRIDAAASPTPAYEAVVPSLANVGICVTIKNEEPYLLEWVAHHYGLGVRTFFIFDDHSLDEPMDVLGEWIESGLVQYFVVPSQVERTRDTLSVNPQQVWAYGECALRLAPASGLDWLLLIDVDEFLVMDAVNRNEATAAGYGKFPLPWFLSQKPWSDPGFTGGIAVTSFSFSSSGHLDPPVGPVSTSYQLRQSILANGTKRTAMDTKCLMRVGAQTLIENHLCFVEPERRNAHGVVANKFGFARVQIGPPVTGPLSLFHFRSKGLLGCAYRALSVNVAKDYKRAMVVSNCMQLDLENRDELDTRLADQVNETMKTARCLHPRRWRCRFGRLFPEIDAQPILELCKSAGLFGLDLANSAFIPRTYAGITPFEQGNWLSYEKTKAMQPRSPEQYGTAGDQCWRVAPDLSKYEPSTFQASDVPSVKSWSNVDNAFWSNVTAKRLQTKVEVFQFLVETMKRELSKEKQDTKK